MSERLLNIAQVADRIGFRQTFIWEQLRRGRFPAPRVPYSGAKSKRWLEADIDEWIRSRPTADELVLKQTTSTPH